MADKIQIQNPVQFEMAIGSIASSSKMMGSFDWDHILKAMELGEGVGAVFKPELFQQIQKDPQWEIKKRMLRAARTFVAEVEAAAAEL